MKIVSRGVVLTVADHEQGAFLMCAPRNTFDAEVNGVVKGSVVLWLNKRPLLKHGTAVAGSVEQAEAATERDQEIFVRRMALSSGSA
ncbi:MAG: hypothetical protein M9893_11730 [Pyrinomonadaceae bacterium]|nr:hypothetical protein [Pyrinomonadaceae bacterium]